MNIDDAALAESLRRLSQPRDDDGTITSALQVVVRACVDLFGVDGAFGLYAAGTRGRGGSIGTALTALLDRGEVVADASTRTGHRVVDPLLALWLREGRPQEWPE